MEGGDRDVLFIFPFAVLVGAALNFFSRWAGITF